MATQRIDIPGELFAQLQAMAEADGKSVDEIAIAALMRGMAQRALDRMNHRAEVRRAEKSDEEIEEIVAAAIDEARRR